jgi:nicotinamidase-related amidase
MLNHKRIGVPPLSTALLIVDVQNGLVNGPEPVYKLDQLLANISSLITQARSTGIPIIYVQDNDVDEIGSPGWQIHPAIAPTEEDIVIRKPEADAFYGTTLQKEMEQRGIDHLVVVGCKSEVCIDATCRGATHRGYNTTLASDAHSTTDNEVLTAKQTIAYHNYILSMVWSDEHGEDVGVTVKPTADIVLK